MDDLFAIGRFTQEEVVGFHEYTDNIVFLDSDLESMRYYSILPNYHLAVRLTLKHLRMGGHQLIVCLSGVNTFSGHKELKMNPRFYYYRVSQANRGSYNSSLVLNCGMNTKSGYAAMRNLLETYGRSSETTFIASDSTASGAIVALRERRLRVPEDISIITFNNIALSEHPNSPLTSIEPFIRENVRVATFCMQFLWQGSIRGKRVVVPCELVS